MTVCYKTWSFTKSYSYYLPNYAYTERIDVLNIVVKSLKLTSVILEAFAETLRVVRVMVTDQDESPDKRIKLII